VFPGGGIVAVDLHGEAALTGKLVVCCGQLPRGIAKTTDRRKVTASIELVEVYILKGRCAAEAVIQV